MIVTPQLIKQLREMTSAGMMDCKKALNEKNGNIEEAIIWLRENGLAKAAKKANRVAAEGVVVAKENNNKVIIFEVNSETDFVSKNEKFLLLIDSIKNSLLLNEFQSHEQALKVKLKNGQTIEEACIEATATIGEKIEFRRIKSFNIENGHTITTYNHSNKKIAVVLDFEGPIDKTDAYNVAMHVAAMSPKYLTVDEIPQEFKDIEMNIIKETTDLTGKSEKVANGILIGKLNKKLSEVALFEQPFVMDEKQKVKQFIDSKKSKLVKMIRLEVGEGIQKENVDFAVEVAAQLGQ